MHRNGEISWFYTIFFAIFQLNCSRQKNAPDSLPGDNNALDLHRYIRYGTVFLLQGGNVLQIPFLGALEHKAYDARMLLMPPRAREKHVVIVDIDEPSLDALGRWPWTRDVIGNIVDNLFDHYGVTTIGFDVVFAEADEDATAAWLKRLAEGPLKNNNAFQLEYANIADSLHRDDRLARSLRNRKTVLGFIFGSNTRKGVLPAPVAAADGMPAAAIPFLKADGYTANLAELQAGAHSAGFFDNPFLDNDGVYRRVPLLQEFNARLYASLPLAVVQSALDSPDIELVVRSSVDQDDGQAFLEWLRIHDLLVPVDGHAGVLIPYVGGQRSFTYIPAVDILEKTADVADLRGKIVLFGSSAPGLFDLHTTPVEPAFPGIEIHANVIQGILDQTIMHRPRYMPAVEILFLLATGILLTFLLPVLSPWQTLVVTGTVAAFLFTGSLLAWHRLQLVVSIATPMTLILTLFIFHTSFGFSAETRRRRRLARMFGQYVPPELVEEMCRTMPEVRVDGEMREMSVLFSDVHHFTAISEHMEPRQLTQLLNGILTPITEAIHEQRGTIDKYMGDAVMAFWGAPVADADHAAHALAAAIEMVRRIEELGPVFRSRGWPDIRIGIGVNTGTMNVGNKGSRFRVDYTVIGDAVNLGSRLEGLTRVYGVDIIAGENTRHAASSFEFRELDRVRVKGRDAPLVIYEPLGPVSAIAPAERADLDRFHQALESYRSRHWEEAERSIAALSEAEPSRRIYRIYLERIAHFRECPPPDDWDGSFQHLSK